MSTLLMATAFVVAIGGALGTNANASPKFLNKIQGVLNQTCSPVTSICGSGSIACSFTNIYADNASHTCLTLLTKQP